MEGQFPPAGVEPSAQRLRTLPGPQRTLQRHRFRCGMQEESIADVITVLVILKHRHYQAVFLRSFRIETRHGRQPLEAREHDL